MGRLVIARSPKGAPMTTSGEVAREVESRNAQTVAEAEARGRQRGGRRRRPTGAAAASAPQPGADRQALDRGPGRGGAGHPAVPGVGGRPAAGGPGRCRGAALPRHVPHPLAHQPGPGHRPRRHRLVDDVLRPRRRRGADGVPALAPPVHVPGRHPGHRARRRRAVSGLLPAPALRRGDHREMGGLLLALAAGRARVRGARGRPLQPGARGSGPEPGQVGRGRRAGRDLRCPALPGGGAPVRRGRGPDHRHRVPAGRVPAVHAQRVRAGGVRAGKTAHLDVGGRRGEAIIRAVQDQLA
jgi:hypothetical protein